MSAPQPAISYQSAPHPAVLQTLYDKTVAQALDNQPLFDQPVTLAVKPQQGQYLQANTPDSKPFRVLCNCATANPKEHTERYISSNLASFRWPSESAIREHLRPRAASPEELAQIRGQVHA